MWCQSCCCNMCPRAVHSCSSGVWIHRKNHIQSNLTQMANRSGQVSCIKHVFHKRSTSVLQRCGDAEMCNGLAPRWPIANLRSSSSTSRCALKMPTLQCLHSFCADRDTAATVVRLAWDVCHHTVRGSHRMALSSDPDAQGMFAVIQQWSQKSQTT